MGSPVPTRQLFISSANHQRLERAAEYLRSQPGDSEVLVLAPTRGAADDLVRSSANLTGSAFGVHRLTLVQLAASLAAEPWARLNLAPLSRLGMEALAARSVYVCRQEAELGYFHPVADTPGFPRALASTLGELRLERVDPSRLAATGAPGRDLARLLECYAKQLKERSLADLAATFTAATEVARGGKHRLLGLPMLWIDVSADSALEREFLEGLAAKSPAIVATALADDEEQVSTLERILGVTAECVDQTSASVPGRAATGSKSKPEQRPLLAESEPSSLDRLRRYVFSTEAPPPRKLDSSVDFFSAPGEGLECVEIARRIRQAAERGTSFDQVAILLRHPNDYLPLVEDALRRAAIPGCFTVGTVRPHPAGRAFLALLDCAAEGLSASKFAEYLSLGQVPMLEESGAPPEPIGRWIAPEDEAQGQFSFLFPGTTSVPPVVDGSSVPSRETPTPLETDEWPVIDGTLRAPFGWEKLLIDAAVIGGKDRWSRRLAGLRAEFNLQLRELEGEDESRREFLERQRRRLDHLERFALPVIEFLDSLPQQARWGDWLRALRSLAETALRDPDSVLAVLSELEPMGEVGPVELPEIRQVLTERLSFLRRDPPLRRYGHVLVATIEEAAGRSFEMVFLPGLAEGVFPRRPSEDPLLLDEYRKQAGSALTIQNDRLREERLLLRTAVAAGRRTLHVSYPRMDTVEGRARVPSFYALEVLRAAEGRLPALAELEKRAAEAAESRLGWPAPKDPQLALDDAEYDLAVLEPLLHRPPEEVKGHGVYLLEESKPLERSLRTRWKRWDPRWWPDADGLFKPEAPALAVLKKHSMPVRSYSASALQHYAVCPYQFLLYAIFRLRERDRSEAIERMDPLTRGALFHEVQFRFLTALRKAKLIPIDAGSLAHATDVGDKVFAKVAADYEEKLAPAIPRVWKSELEDLRIDLRGWIRQLVNIHVEWIPLHSEFAFGLPPGPARETERDTESLAGDVEILPGIRLRGSIDLVEQHSASGALRVTDHKTGRAQWPEPRSVGKGEVLQPLLYALAVEKIFQRPAKSGVLYFCTQRGGYRSVEIPLNNEGRMRIEMVLRTIGDAVRTGTLLAAPRKDACARCDYRMVCGPYEERRVREKRERLDALEDVRCQP